MMNETPLAELGLEPPPANPFGQSEVVTYDPEAAEPERPARAGTASRAKPPQFNRKQRRSMRATALADVRLLARVVRYDLAQRPKDQPASELYPTELAATYGLEQRAKEMRLAGLITRAEQHRVVQLARYRRAAIKRT